VAFDGSFIVGYVAGVKGKLFQLCPRGERERELLATKRIPVLVVMMMAEDDEIAGMPRAVSMHLIGMVRLDKLFPVLGERDITALRRKLAR